MHRKINRKKTFSNTQCSGVSVILYARADYIISRKLRNIKETLAIILGKNSRHRPIIDVYN